MIRVGFKVSALSPKKMGNGNTMFSIIDYDKKNPSDKNYITVFCTDAIELTDKQKVKITAIDGIGCSKYKGQSQCSMSCTVVAVDEAEQEQEDTPPTPKPKKEAKPKPQYQPEDDEDFNTSPLLDISSDDLPF